MTGMTKPTFPTASLIVQAAMAAAFLVGVTGVARAQAVIKDDGGLVQWTIGLSGTSAASGVSAVNLPQGAEITTELSATPRQASRGRGRGMARLQLSLIYSRLLVQYLWVANLSS